MKCECADMYVRNASNHKAKVLSVQDNDKKKLVVPDTHNPTEMCHMEFQWEW